jgi:tRNA (cmo5U34)-methyltransferase
MTEDFSFAAHADSFDEHIRSSIPSYDSLIKKCIGLSRRFVQPDTTVIDVGCSTGRLLASIRQENRRQNVTYIGIDIEEQFNTHWLPIQAGNIRFEASDARTFASFENISLACSIFTLQFIPPRDKRVVLRNMYAGLVEGGALIIAEKILASTSRIQDALTFPYLDYKREQGFSPAEILDKERNLRGQMTLWTRDELVTLLRETGFRELEPIWESFPFTALLALR